MTGYFTDLSRRKLILAVGCQNAMVWSQINTQWRVAFCTRCQQWEGNRSNTKEHICEDGDRILFVPTNFRTTYRAHALHDLLDVGMVTEDELEEIDGLEHLDIATLLMDAGVDMPGDLEVGHLRIWFTSADTSDRHQLALAIDRVQRLFFAGPDVHRGLQNYHIGQQLADISYETRRDYIVSESPTGRALIAGRCKHNNTCHFASVLQSDAFLKHQCVGADDNPIRRPDAKRGKQGTTATHYQIKNFWQLPPPFARRLMIDWLAEVVDDDIFEFRLPLPFLGNTRTRH
jgi:hypothetical protein